MFILTFAILYFTFIATNENKRCVLERSEFAANKKKPSEIALENERLKFKNLLSRLFLACSGTDAHTHTHTRPRTRTNRNYPN